MLIVGMSGKIGAGKDTIVDDFMEGWENKLYIGKYSFATQLKEYCYRHFGLSREKMYGSQEDKKELTHLSLEDLGRFFVVSDSDWDLFGPGKLSYRHLLQFVGNGMRQIDNLSWVRPTFNSIKESNKQIVSQGWDEDDVVFITDVRYKTEAEYIKEQGGYIVRLTRYKELINHPSETDMDNYKWNFVIDNVNMSRDEQVLKLRDIVNSCLPPCSYL